MEKVIERAYSLNLLPEMRVRISVLDEYRHVKERMQKIMRQTVYSRNRFYVSDEMFTNVQTGADVHTSAFTVTGKTEY